MCRKGFQTFPGFYIPNPDGFIERTAYYQVGLRVEIYTKYVVRVAFQRFQQLSLQKNKKKRGGKQQTTRGKESQSCSGKNKKGFRKKRTVATSKIRIVLSSLAEQM